MLFRSLTQPATGASFGISSLAEMRGAAAGASARIAVCAADNDSSVVAGAQWSVSVDQGVAGQTTVTWIDMRRLGNTTDRFSFAATLFHASGVVTMNYGTTFPVTGFTGRFVGISIGNNVGTTTSPNSDMSATPNSGTVGLLYQNFTGTAPHAWDLTGQTLTISPNGTGGYVASALVPYVPPTCAFAASYGTGCYSIPGNNSVHQIFAGSPAAKAALDGNSMSLTKTSLGYNVAWNGAAGPAFVTPGGGATTLTFADDDDGDVTYTPAFGPLPIPGGSVATVNVAVNGILTMAGVANNVGDFSPAAADMTSAALAPNIGVYGYWRDMLLSDTAPAVNGTITAEEVGNMLYLSWNAVECYNTALANPSTFQYQVNMATGDITVVWVSLDNSANTSSTGVGVTLAGAGTTPGAVTLSTGLPVSLTSNINPLTLTTTGRPVITLGGAGPSQPITYTVSPVVDSIPPTLTAFSWLIFSVNQDLTGTDLAPAMPGCNVHIGTLDVVLPFPATLGSSNLVITFPQPLSPGLNFYSQALSLFPAGTYPGGLNPFGGVTSNGIKTNFQLQ